MRAIKNMNWAMAVAGLWAVIAPFLLGYRSTSAALWNDLIVGIVIIVLAVVSALSENENNVKTINWVTAVGGLWLVLAPFILGYSAIAAALWSDIIVGIVVLVLSVWSEITLPKVMRHAS